MSAFSDINATQYPDWEPQFREALVETDPEKLKEKVAAVENALFLRWQNMNGSSGAEREAMDEACRVIKQILVDKLGYPDGASNNQMTPGEL